MVSAKSYAKAYLAASQSLAAEERIGWLMALADRQVQRTLGRILQQPDAREQLRALSAPLVIIRFLQVLASDRALRQVGAIAQQGLTVAFQQGLATPVEVTSARDLAGVEVESLMRTLESELPAPVLVQTETNPSLLGGLSLNIGGTRIDRSVRSAVSALATQLKG